MPALVIALGYCWAIWRTVRAGWPGLSIHWPDRRSAILGGAVAAVLYFVFGPFLTPGILASMYLHELGHVLALRSVGQPAAFRAIPAFSALPSWRMGQLSPGQAAFVSLMGAGLTLPVIVLAIAVAQMTAVSSPLVTNHFAAFAAVASLYSAFGLLPYLPLPGGRVFTDAGTAIWPLLPLVAGGALLAVTLTFAVGYQSLTLGFIAFVGIRGLMTANDIQARPMDREIAIWTLAAYGALLVCLVNFGWPFILYSLGA